MGWNLRQQRGWFLLNAPWLGWNTWCKEKLAWFQWQVTFSFLSSIHLFWSILQCSASLVFTVFANKYSECQESLERARKEQIQLFGWPYNQRKNWCLVHSTLIAQRHQSIFLLLAPQARTASLATLSTACDPCAASLHDFCCDLSILLVCGYDSFLFFDAEENT